MRKHYRRFLILAAIFIGSSALLYFIHFRIFQDPHHIFIYMLGDLAFLPLEAFIVVIVIERIMAYREKQTPLSKLNMVVGAFYSEVGNHLIADLICSLDNREETFQCLAVSQNWTVADFKKATLCAQNIKVNTECNGVDFKELRAFLIEKREFLLRLLENPNLLEHERFTDLMWAVFHLAEELEARPTIDNLPVSDREHLAGDIQRVYGQLVAEWVRYLEHLKAKYPYLFSLVLRTHPFQTNPSPVVA
ncbi:MAG: hypothetical protein JW790_01025 [Dehalococcoidales bacterium]|nr:hypothetical protein [Dehalococcoidales bacterium]